MSCVVAPLGHLEQSWIIDGVKPLDRSSNAGALPFDGLADHYDQGRRSYPSEVLDWCVSQIPAGAPQVVLDMGCGTGISTRQLSAPDRVVLGVDPDAGMLRLALERSCSGIAYLRSSVADLLLPGDVAHAVTMFGSLHWFTDPASLAKICDVLRPDGVVIVVNRRDADSFRSDLTSALHPFFEGRPRRPKEAFDPIDVFDRAGLSVIDTIEFARDERYDAVELALHVQSMHCWAMVPALRRPEALEAVVESLLQDRAEYTRHVIFQGTSAAGHGESEQVSF